MTGKQVYKVGFKKLRDTAVIPIKNPGDSGMDLAAAVSTVILPGTTGVVETGLAVELPANTELQVRSRSGLAAKKQIVVANSPGTIDESFKGEIGVILHNGGTTLFEIAVGERIAQAVIQTLPEIEVEEITDLSSSNRGEGRLGSTGV